MIHCFGNSPFKSRLFVRFAYIAAILIACGFPKLGAGCEYNVVNNSDRLIKSIEYCVVGRGNQVCQTVKLPIVSKLRPQRFRVDDQSITISQHARIRFEATLADDRRAPGRESSVRSSSTRPLNEGKLCDEPNITVSNDGNEYYLVVN